MAVDYYLNSLTGDDARRGNTPDNAWQTLSKVNATTFQAGDRILLAAGSSWTGMLRPLGSGRAGAPITISSCGDGPRPVIDGGGAPAAIWLEDQQHWAIENLEIRNTATNRMVQGYLSGKHRKEGKETAVPGERSGIAVRAAGTQRLAGLRIAHCDIHSVQGSSWRLAQPGMYDNAGIHVNTAAPFDGVVIENNTVHDLDTIGIIAWVGTGGKAHNWQAQDPGPWGRGLVVKNNRVVKTGADGIIVGSSDGALIEGNVCFDAGAHAMKQPAVSGDPKADVMHIAGIWCIASREAVFQHNEVARVRVFEQPADSMAFDVDVGCRGTITFQHNYTHDNPGGTLMIMNWNPNLERVIYRDNSSQDDGARNKFGCQIAIVDHAGQMCRQADLYNNVFHVTQDESGYRVSDVAIAVYRSNIFSFAGPPGSREGWIYPQRPVFEANCYAGHVPAVADPGKIIAAPLDRNQRLPRAFPCQQNKERMR